MWLSVLIITQNLRGMCVQADNFNLFLLLKITSVVCLQQTKRLDDQAFQLAKYSKTLRLRKTVKTQKGSVLMGNRKNKNKHGKKHDVSGFTMPGFTNTIVLKRPQKDFPVASKPRLLKKNKLQNKYILIKHGKVKPP